MTSSAAVEATPATGTPTRWMPIAGWILSALPVLMLAMSATMKLMHNPKLVETLGTVGWSESDLLGLGILELSCALLYVIPRTAVLGAILVTGYLGGAVATHVRVGQSFAIPLALGVFAWAGLYLREARLRALLPLK